MKKSKNSFLKFFKDTYYYSSELINYLFGLGLLLVITIIIYISGTIFFKDNFSSLIQKSIDVITILLVIFLLITFIFVVYNIIKLISKKLK